MRTSRSMWSRKMVNEMFDSGNGPNGCGSADNLVGYLYGEMEEAAKAEFEVHLADCSSCAEELATFSALRISIGEWKTSEQNDVQASAAKEPSARGFLAGLKEALSASFGIKALAGASIAVLVIILGVIAFSILTSQDTADQIANVAPAEEMPVKAPAESVSKPAGDDIAETGTSGKEPATETEPMRVSDQPERTRPNSVPVKKRSSQRRDLVPPGQIAENNDPPRLSEAAEEEFEDDSLRLTDLFSETSED